MISLMDHSVVGVGKKVRRGRETGREEKRQEAEFLRTNFGA